VDDSAIAVFLAASTGKATSIRWQTIADLMFTITCATTSVALLAVFVRFAKKSRGTFDNLHDNA
jgi:hypothetical protein